MTPSVALCSACILASCKHYNVPVDRVRANGQRGNTHHADALQAAAHAIEKLCPGTTIRSRAIASAVAIERFQGASVISRTRYTAEPAFAEVVDTIIAEAKRHDYLPERRKKRKDTRYEYGRIFGETQSGSIHDSPTLQEVQAFESCDDETAD